MENADGNDVIQNGHGKQGAGHRTFGVEFLHDGERRCRCGRQCNAAERQREIQRRHHHCLAEQPCKVGILPEEIHADVKIADNPALRAAVPAVGKMLRQIGGQRLKTGLQTAEIEIVAGIEIMIDDSLGDAAGLADRVERRALISILCKFAEGMGENSLPRLLFFSSRFIGTLLF